MSCKDYVGLMQPYEHYSYVFAHARNLGRRNSCAFNEYKESVCEKKISGFICCQLCHGFNTEGFEENRVTLVSVLEMCSKCSETHIHPE